MTENHSLLNFPPISSFTSLSCAEETTLSITPSKATLPPGRSRTFKAGGIAPSRKAVWSVQEGAAGGSITSNGVYTAPSIPGTYHVILSRPGLRPRKAAATITVTGGLTPIAGSPYAVGFDPRFVMVHPAGKFVYAVNRSDYTVSGFAPRSGDRGARRRHRLAHPPIRLPFFRRSRRRSPGGPGRSFGPVHLYRK